MGVAQVISACWIHKGVYLKEGPLPATPRRSTEWERGPHARGGEGHGDGRAYPTPILRLQGERWREWERERELITLKRMLRAELERKCGGHGTYRGGTVLLRSSVWAHKLPVRVVTNSAHWRWFLPRCGVSFAEDQLGFTGCWCIAVCLHANWVL